MNQGFCFIAATGLLALLTLASGCAVNITTENFLHQDEAVRALSLDKMRRELDKELSGYRIESISATTEDGAQLEGVRFTREGAIANLVFFGGNGMTISSSFTILKRFAQIPANVTWFDYRASGASEKRGNLTIEQIKNDALVVIDAAGKQFDKNLPLVIHGMSMGSLVASHVATQLEIDGLVLDSAITTVPALVDNMAPSFASTTIQPELAEINNLDLLRQYHGPLMLLVGDEDETTPVEFSKTLLEVSVSESKSLVVIPGRDHGYSIKSEAAIKEYRSFIDAL